MSSSKYQSSKTQKVNDDQKKTVLFVILALVLVIVVIFVVYKIKTDKKNSPKTVSTFYSAQQSPQLQQQINAPQTAYPQEVLPPQVMQASTADNTKMLEKSQVQLDSIQNLFNGSPFTDTMANDPTQLMAANQMSSVARLMPSNWDSQTTQISQMVAGTENWSPYVMNKQGHDQFVRASGEMRNAIIDRPVNPWGKGGMQLDKFFRPPVRVVVDPNAVTPFNDSEYRLDTIYNLTGQYPTQSNTQAPFTE